MKILYGLSIVAIAAWALGNTLDAKDDDVAEEKTKISDAKLSVATFGGGCFWCTEALLETLDGVDSVVSGYAGGHQPNPTYKEVCAETTGHAEVVQVAFDSTLITFDELLAYFWQSHNPTTLNRQGNDVGTQYRSVILYHNEDQKEIAEQSKAHAKGSFDDPIVTEIAKMEKFYPAEKYHQDYFRKNPNQGYCYFVIKPKLQKFKKAKIK
ncbi:peptide-methionine (S)-S-oxide reductase MsrA [Verrucomicrobia bacterium]|jgi:peptide-methionine (S)-S-oxide reductase|nr:peptide-methionine (S)-S-oxide reductase MsrA [Verrucomicrobiota bacterium]MDA7510052.1 peptide-methionine (S)-S-oxide reductase MsrA [Verrucomicrobiota bacterium]MDA7645537.1 peptide-methionine (S)-S-oxide reductase MsrA [bacterium]MDA7657339.1 peptide-methionine (S)-S-oxide reductase MsrA [Verrucomicrobiota bacterium]